MSLSKWWDFDGQFELWIEYSESQLAIIPLEKPKCFVKYYAEVLIKYS